MRLIFFGTPAFAVPTLESIVRAGHEVLSVVTQPDRPKGRGYLSGASAVKHAALQHNLAVYQPERIRQPDVLEHLAALGAESMIVVGYGKIIPQSIIDLPPRGIINVHASLLPKYRGAAPIQWAIINGERQTGVTTMRIDAGLDTGDMLLQAETEIGVEETSPELGARLARMGADLLVETLDRLAAGSVIPQKQNPALATYAPILKKEDGLVDWRLPAATLQNRVRGLQPWPGAYTTFRGRSLHIWRARILDEDTGLMPGTLLYGGHDLHVACGAGTVLELLEVQLEGRKKMSAEDFANGQRLSGNLILGEAQS